MNPTLKYSFFYLFHNQLLDLTINRKTQSVSLISPQVVYPFLQRKRLQKQKPQVLFLLRLVPFGAAFTTKICIIYQFVGVWSDHLAWVGSFMQGPFFGLLCWASFPEQVNRIISFDSEVDHFVIFAFWQRSPAEGYFFLALTPSIIYQIFYPFAYCLFTIDPTLCILLIMFLQLLPIIFPYRAETRLLCLVWSLTIFWGKKYWKDPWAYVSTSFLRFPFVERATLVVFVIAHSLEAGRAAWIFESEGFLGWLQALGDKVKDSIFYIFTIH